MASQTQRSNLIRLGEAWAQDRSVGVASLSNNEEVDSKQNKTDPFNTFEIFYRLGEIDRCESCDRLANKSDNFFGFFV